MVCWEATWKIALELDMLKLNIVDELGNSSRIKTWQSSVSQLEKTFTQAMVTLLVELEEFSLIKFKLTLQRNTKMLIQAQNYSPNLRETSFRKLSQTLSTSCQKMKASKTWTNQPLMPATAKAAATSINETLLFHVSTAVETILIPLTNKTLCLCKLLLVHLLE